MLLVALPSHVVAAGEGLFKVVFAGGLGIPDGNLVAPPELPADGPVALLAQPVQITLGVTRGNDLHAGVGHGVHGRLGKIVHLDKPLVGQERLDGRLRAVGVCQVDLAIFHPDEQPLALEVGHHVAARLQHRLTRVWTGVLVEHAVKAEDVDQGQAMAQADFVVVGVVGRGDLHTPGAHLRPGPRVCHQRDLPLQQRQHHLSAGQGHLTKRDQLRKQLLAALADVVQLGLDLGLLLLGRCRQAGSKIRFGLLQGPGRIRMHGHGRIAQHGFRPSGGDCHVCRFARGGIDHRVVEVPEMSRDHLVKHLVVADGRLQCGVPVDQPLAAIDQPPQEEAEERVADRPGANGIQRESGPIPVATAAHLLELPQDSSFILVLPGPDPLHQTFPPQIVPGLALFAKQPPLDHGLSGDSGVVSAGQPESGEPLHPLLTYEHVLERVVQCVPQVQGPGDVGRGDNDGVRLAVGRGLAVEVASLLPMTIPAVLCRGMIVLLRQLSH